MLVKAEPTKQKTRRPEQRGITRAVSAKKTGKKKRKCPGSGMSRERRRDRTAERRDSKRAIVAAPEVSDDVARRVSFAVSRYLRGSSRLHCCSAYYALLGFWMVADLTVWDARTANSRSTRQAVAKEP